MPIILERDGSLHLQTIARALEKCLLADPECAVHWVAVFGESSLDPPQRLWEFDEAMLQVGMTEGNSEGMLVYVHAQIDRYMPGVLTPLLRIKVLCGSDRAAAEIARGWRFFRSAEFTRLVQPEPAAAAA